MNANQRKQVEKTLKNYQEKKYTKLDELMALDRKARSGANVFAYIFGTIGSLVLGLGMCLAMGVMSMFTGLGWMIVGIIIGLVGIAMVSLNYVFYKAILKKGKAKYASQIKELSEELLND